jgi:hypothetical protein
MTRTDFEVQTLVAGDLTGALQPAYLLPGSG